jgi:hypothetical protein
LKTNFERITETPEALSEFIKKQYGFSQVEEDGHYYNLLFWFNYSEDQEDNE